MRSSAAGEQVRRVDTDSKSVERWLHQQSGTDDVILMIVAGA
jgi:hypothetical protein